MQDVVIVSGARTPVGTFGGALKTVPVVELGSIVMKAVLKRAGLRPVSSDLMKACSPDRLKDQGLTELEKQNADWDAGLPAVTIDEVVMGNVLTTGQGQNPARQAMIKAGLPKETPAFTLNKVCGSGLKAISYGAMAIMTGQADAIIAGGQENMSQVPFSLPDARWGYRMALTGVGEIHDLMVFAAITWALPPKILPPCTKLPVRNRMNSVF